MYKLIYEEFVPDSTPTYSTTPYFYRYAPSGIWIRKIHLMDGPRTRNAALCNIEISKFLEEGKRRIIDFIKVSEYISNY